ncbi:MAG: YihY/virulence factor BrkB family protein [Firmicutes bacterium]|nr:YihY/virulence factor BrkB family protein [Bacillota bacterium]
MLIKFDKMQKKFRTIAIIVAVIKKCNDDQANLFVILLGWYSFMSIYPLLLILVTALNLIGEKSLGVHIVSLVDRFPVIGRQFGSAENNKRLSGSILVLVVGVISLTYGSLGVARSLQKSLFHMWNIPRTYKGSLVFRLYRNILTIFVLGVVFLLNSVAASFSLGTSIHILIAIPSLLAIIIVNVYAYHLVFSLQNPEGILVGSNWPGSIAAGLLFTAMTTIGASLVWHELIHSSETYGAFSQVIGVIVFLLIIAKITVYASELNCVLAQNLFPRSITKKSLTAADKKVYELLILEQQMDPKQKIDITYPLADS